VTASRRLVRCAGVLLLAAAAAACASTKAFRAGERAERRQDFDAAVLEYAKAARLDPDNLGYRKSLERAKLRASAEHTAAARRLLARGLYKEALDEFRLAFNLDPSSPTLPAEIREAEARRQEGAAPPSMAEIKERTRERALPGLELGPGAREPLGLVFRSASLREAYQALGRTAGINFVFDPQFQDQTISLDLREVPFEQALNALASVGRTFHRVTDARIVSVIPDTPTKRREFEQLVVKTFFLSNADLKETVDLLRIVLSARNVAPVVGANALSIKDTPDKVAAAERIINMVDKKRAEVVVEVEILEVNRTRLKDYGIEITSAVSGTEGIAGAAFPLSTTLDENPYKRSNIVVSSLPGVIYRLLRSDSSTRLLANPQIRTSEGQTAQARFGDQVPVPVTTFTPIAGTGLQQQPITSFEYKNVGVNIDITPRVHHDGEISLGLKLDISSVGPAGFQGLPTFNSRTVSSVIRLKDGETNVLAGLISDNERKSLSGVPGLASVPVLGRIFARNRNEVTETDIIMTLTPHIVGRPEITEQDLRSFPLGSESSPLLFEVPGIPPVQPAPRSPEPPRIEPIRPPSPAPTPTPPPE
jgi:general secretion pathway protein D